LNWRASTNAHNRVRRLLFGRQPARRIELHACRGGRFKGIAVHTVRAQADEAALRETRDGVRRDAARREVGGRDAGGGAGEQLKDLELATLKGSPCRIQRLEPRGRNGGDADRLVRVLAPAARHRRQHRRDRIARSCCVVLGGPLSERHDVRRHERAGVQNLPHRLDAVTGNRRRRVVVHDDAGDDAVAERHDDARADNRTAGVLRDAICEQAQAWDWNGYLD